MKNFSTVGARIVGLRIAVRLAVATLLAGLSWVPGYAATCTFRVDAPGQHLVVSGDTLWGIAEKFLDNPWCWSEVWGLNREQIANPHWIYPGQTIYFDRNAGRLSLDPSSATPGGATRQDPPLLRLSPQLRTQALGKDAVAAIPAGVIEPFLSQPLIVEADELKGAPVIVATQDGHVYLGKDDKAYVRGELGGGTSFQVFRAATPLTDPETGKTIAFEASYLGSMKLKALAKGGSDVHTFSVSSSKQEMGTGDLLKATPPVPNRNYAPHQPERPVVARVMSIHGGVDEGGQNQVVSINRGALDGLDIGAVLQLYHVGRTVADPTASKGMLGLGRPTVKLPDEQYGTLFVFRVFKHVSYGLIMQVTEPVLIGAVAKSPQ